MTPTVHDTFILERSYRKPAAAVFVAFADPAKKRRWYADGEGHDVDSFEMDFRVGGVERSTYRLGPQTPFPGTPLTSDGHYEDIVENKRIVISATMAIGGHRISTVIATFELFEDDGGTRLVLTHQAAFYEGADGPAMRRGGWEKLLDRLAVELGE